MQFTLREFLSIVLSKDDKLGEIAECGGPSRGNTIIGAGLEDAFERGANVQMGVWASETLVQFVGKIFFSVAATASRVMGTAQATGKCRHEALAAISEREAAKVIESGLAPKGHPRSLSYR